MKRRTLFVGASIIGIAAVGTTVALEPLGAEPEGEKDCGNVLPPSPASSSATASNQVREPRWEQKGGTVNDASCLSRTAVAGVVSPRSEKEVQQALAYANAAGLTISPAGVRHSMGGHVIPARRHHARHARHERHPRRSRTIDGHGRRGRELARYPERHPSALRGKGDAIDRHLHRRRLDLGQCPRDGPSGRSHPELDPIAAPDARRRPDRNDLAPRSIRSSSTSSSAATDCSASSCRPSSMSFPTPSTDRSASWSPRRTCRTSLRRSSPTRRSD